MNTDSSLPRGIVCTPEEYTRSLNDSTIHCLTRGETIGLTIVAEAGLISLVAVSYVFLVILRNVAWRFRNISGYRWHVFHAKPIDLLMFSLFFADFLQALGVVMVLKWVVDGSVQAGRFCSAQGILLQLGGTAVAITTTIITVYTFLGIWLGKDIKSMWITAILMFATWGFTILMVILGNAINAGPGKAPYEAPTPYWGWISESYLQWGIWGQYFLYWLALAFSIVLYVPLWLWSRGNIIINDNTPWKFKVQSVDATADPALKRARRQSLIMLLYPLVYTVTVVPLSVVRFIGFFHERNGGPIHVPFAATHAVFAIFSFGGACNAVLLLATRPNAVPFENHFHLSTGVVERRMSSPSSAFSKTEKQSICDTQDLDDIELARLPSRS